MAAEHGFWRSIALWMLNPEDAAEAEIELQIPAQVSAADGHVYCSYCGDRMKEVLHPNPQFDRATGKIGRRGKVFWQCEHRGTGRKEWLDPEADWAYHHTENPHDKVFMRDE